MGRVVYIDDVYRIESWKLRYTSIEISKLSISITTRYCPTCSGLGFTADEKHKRLTLMIGVTSGVRVGLAIINYILELRVLHNNVNY